MKSSNYIFILLSFLSVQVFASEMVREKDAEKEKDRSSEVSVDDIAATLVSQKLALVFDAISSSDFDGVYKLLDGRSAEENEMLLNTPNEDGVLPLELAILRGSDDLVFHLCMNGANPRLRTKEGKRFVQLASELGRSDIVLTLETFLAEERKSDAQDGGVLDFQMLESSLGDSRILYESELDRLMRGEVQEEVIPDELAAYIPELSALLGGNTTTTTTTSPAPLTYENYRSSLTPFEIPLGEDEFESLAEELALLSLSSEDEEDDLEDNWELVQHNQLVPVTLPLQAESFVSRLRLPWFVSNPAEILTFIFALSTMTQAQAKSL